MNVRELWDTVVLRDVLGYTLPGVVTLLALALLWVTRVGLEPHWCVQVLVVWKNFRWPIVAAILSLGFVVGHLQVQIIGCFEECVPGWNLGKLALHFLSNAQEKMRHAYCEAAVELLDREGKLRGGLANCKLPEHSVRKDKNTEASAKALWRLCDYYILVRHPNSHATYMGRYYVLAVLFSNLGLSAIILAASAAFIVSPSDLSSVIVSLAPALVVACVYFAVVFCVLSPYRRRQGSSCIRREHTLRVTDTILVVVALGALARGSWLGKEILPCAILLLGLVLIYWSGHFRRQFVERAFPIFYVLSQRESNRDETG